MGSDLLGFGRAAVKNRIKRKNTVIGGGGLEKDVFRAFENIFFILPM